MNRGHEIGCPALRGGVPCACWVKPIQPMILKLQRDRLGDVTHLLGHPLRYWLDVDQQLKLRGYDRFLDGFYEAQAKMRLNIRQLEAQVRALDIEWHGLQQMAGDQRKGIIELSEAIDLTGQASPWD